MGRQYFKGGTLMAPLPAALVTCGSGDGRNVENYRGKNICANCMKELRSGK